MPSPVNPIRGEIKVKLGETEFVLVPEYERYAHIEGDLGYGVLQAMERVQLRDFRAVVTVLARGSRTKLGANEIGALIMEHGGLSGSELAGELYTYLAYPAIGFDRVNKMLEDPEKSEEAPKAEEPKSDLAAVA